MKARTRKTRWLLITLLLGFLAAAGVTFVLHRHSGGLLVSAAGIVPADGTSVQQTDTTAPGGVDDGSVQPPAAADARADEYITAGRYSSSVETAADTDSPSTSSGGANEPAGGTVGSGGGTHRQTNSPRGSGNTVAPLPPAGSGYFANGGYLPFDCGTPAGCGGGSETGQSPGSTGGSSGGSSGDSSGGSSSLHNSQGSGPQTDNSGQTTDDSNPGDPGTGNPGPSNPGSGPSVAAAPELDPATLAGALTLLLGALAIVRTRRVRATR